MTAVSAKVFDDSIRVQFQYNSGMVDWMREEISERKWASPDELGLSLGAWIIPKTDSAAYQLLKTCPLDVRGCEEFWKLAKSFQADVEFSPTLRTDLLEPPIRVFDCWKHQLHPYHFCMNRLDAGVGAMPAMGMGTGKTKVAIDISMNRVHKVVLVVCPASVLGVWRREVRIHSPNSNCLILDKGTVKKKVELAQTFITARKYSKDVAPWFVVINYESAIREVFTKWLLRNFWDACILDESHRAKDPTGVTGKLVKKLRPRSKDRLCLTGTPMNNPGDLFSQFRFLDVGIFGDGFIQFKARFAITGQFGEYLGWKRKQEHREKFHSAAIVVSSDVLDLPEVQHLEREFSLPPKVQKIYQSLFDDLIAEVEGGVCTANNALVKLLRCQQITSGFLPLDEEINPFDDDDFEDDGNWTAPTAKVEHLHNEKKKLLTEILKDAGPKDPIIVFCRFRHDLDMVRDVVESLVDAGHTYGEISGRPGRKKDLTEDAKLPEGFSVFGVQIQAGGVGVDFTRSHIAVLLSIDFNLSTYDQMLKRLDRPGQKHGVLYYHLIAEKTVDRKILKSLGLKRNVVSEVMRAIEGGEIDLGGEE